MVLSILLPAFLLSLSACLDNIVIGIAYGMKKTKIPFCSNLLIAVVTSLGTLVSMMFGKLIATIIPMYISKALGAVMIILIGIYFILDYVIKKRNEKNPVPVNEAVCDDSSATQDLCGVQNLCCLPKKINFKETIMLAFALTINNLGIGISASLAGVNIAATVALTFIISILTIVIGVSMGFNIIGRLFGKYASVVSGILMVVLGFVELF